MDNSNNLIINAHMILELYRIMGQKALKLLEKYSNSSICQNDNSALIVATDWKM